MANNRRYCVLVPMQSVEGEHHEKAVELLKAAQGSVKLVVRYTPKVLEEMEARFEKMRSARRRQQHTSYSWGCSLVYTQSSLLIYVREHTVCPKSKLHMKSIQYLLHTNHHKMHFQKFINRKSTSFLGGLSGSVCILSYSLEAYIQWFMWLFQRLIFWIMTSDHRHIYTCSN